MFVYVCSSVLVYARGTVIDSSVQLCCSAVLLYSLHLHSICT